MYKPTIGILTWREGTTFKEPEYFRQLLRAGRRLGAAVFLFSPGDVNVKSKKVKGIFLSSEDKWASRWFRWPDVVIDRYWYTQKPIFKEYVAFRKQPHFLYANSRFANKWRAHEVLYNDENMRKWLPETYLYTSQQRKLLEMLRRHQVIYLKPINGTGGRGILRIDQQNGYYRMLGRDKNRNKKAAVARDASSLTLRVKRWIGRDKYLLQQGLDLGLLRDRSVDIRLLIQKDGSGEWKVTGMGVRVGPENSATANLHGGGKAVEAKPFLASHFGEEKADEIIRECHQLAHQTASTVEGHFGRMMELGLDIGIDVIGRVWLIEINPKPGRDIFREMGQPDLYKLAVQRPLQFALFLTSQQTPDGQWVWSGAELQTKQRPAKQMAKFRQY
ncbi:YheC/YheD family protein [Brevibacillus humidisoli]|uniref:YheC/YheD family endospore coat-associated protein n=1 Tax=Brevibacillus humidisoli TaxID=2895522 RepID=UPI001E42019E|nr:YheC/YheD family protein [Brevibacillus humidisoli]UFJ42700.1 YheC/YheD family protein [Brevibacillus humidisoli]